MPNTSPTNTQPYQIDTLALGPMDNLVYLISDNATKQAAVVDPAWDVDEIRKLAAERGVTISDILLTHSHHDHINGVAELLSHADAQVHLLKPEAQFWGHYLDVPSLHHGGDSIKLGETEINVLHTPGHTPGSACFKVHDELITGDTLFVFGCGRCDLAGGDPEQMFVTLKDMAQQLPAETVIRPGHHYAEAQTSSMAEQIDGNPFLHFCDAHDFVDYRMHRHDKIRTYPYQPIAKDSV